MKGFNCPNCGRRQDTKLKTPSMATVYCPECGRKLFIRMKKGKWSVDIDDEPVCDLTKSQPQPQPQT